MRKIFIALIFVICVFSCCAFSAPSENENENVQPDTELHNVIGGLYTLASAVDINASATPDINQLRRFFSYTDTDSDFLKNAKILRVENSIWVGVPVGKFSTARGYLRSNAPELNITDAPNGYSWLQGDYAWLKAADIVKGKLVPAKISAAEGDGTVFFSTEGQNFWWQATPKFNSNAAASVLKKFRAENPPELHAPSDKSSDSHSIYESVKPSSVRVPDKMHVGSKKSSFDMSIEVGDVIFSPIPGRPR